MPIKKEGNILVVEEKVGCLSETNSTKEKESLKEMEFVDVLKIFSPGTAIRTAIDDILRAEMGALIIIDKEGISSILEGGFRINCKFSSQKLVELAKMDGAIILSNDLKKILYANTLLTPSTKISTKETGTRHKAAERAAKQFGTIVIAISERRNKITLYYKDESYFLDDTSEILRRAAETLQILEKQKDVFDDLLSHLNILEITNLTTISDVSSVLQTLETIRRISDSVKRYLVELGKEGTIVSMRLKELTKSISKERELILKDYFDSSFQDADDILKNMGFDFLLDTRNILRMLFDELHDSPVSPTGFRILSKTNLLERDLKILTESFQTLDQVFELDREKFSSVFKNENFVDALLKEIKNLKEKILMGKKI